MTKLNILGRVSPSAERNKQPILDVLQRVLPEKGLVIEIASGTGQHVMHFARALPGLTWQPSDPDPGAVESIRRWLRHEDLSNVREPLEFDVRLPVWPVVGADALLCINMIHISPWEAGLSLIQGAARLLDAGGVFFLYGPYRRVGRHTGPGNEAFDADLRARNATWGVRDLEEVTREAGKAGFALEEVISMPADNLSLVFRRA